MLWYTKTGKVDKTQKMSLHFNIEPKWNIDDYKALNFKLDKHKNEDDNQRYINAGHPKDALTLYNYFQPNPMPDSIEHITKYFTKLSNISVAVNLMRPGQYIPIHYDRYDAYKKYHGLGNNCGIARYLVMLEDSQPGQMLNVNNIVYNNWKAGGVFGWYNNDIHTFYNLSTKDRYAVQVTGTY